MQNEKLISVILPVYNGEKYIAEAIESVLSQTYSHFELIIINDGSIDKSNSIITSFSDKRIVYIENETNLGLIRTLNKGISIAKGEYIARMDADDVCHPTRFDKQISFLKNNTNHVLCGSWAKIINGTGTPIGRMKRINSNDLLRVNMLFTTPFIHPSVMIRREILKTHPYSPEALHCEDLELWCRLAKEKEYQFANLPEYLLEYRWHDSNVSIENADYQSEKRIGILTEMIKILIEEPSPEEIRTHFSLFNNETHISELKTRLQIKDWYKKLLKANAVKSFFDQRALESLLLSRWIVLCIKNKSIQHIFSNGLSWWRPNVLAKAARLLLYK